MCAHVHVDAFVLFVVLSSGYVANSNTCSSIKILQNNVVIVGWDKCQYNLKLSIVDIHYPCQKN